MNELRFGTAGIPLCTDGNTVEGIKTVRRLGLGAMELEFVHSVNITQEKAPGVKKAATAEDVALTCHGQYYINLNSKEKAKQAASKERILNAARAASMCGAFSVTFHAAFYQQMEKENVYRTVKAHLQEITKTLKHEGHLIWIRPELTGKETQFGNLKDLLRLSQEIEHVMPCLDFSHLHARYNGRYNTEQEFTEVLSEVETALGKEGLSNMHIHLSGIAYGEKGEKNHLVLKDSDLNYADLLRAWKAFNLKGVVICESPNIEKDALLLQKTYKSLG